MSFLHPEFLYYMLPPLFILFGLLLTQKESQAAFFSNEVMERLRVSANTLTLKARNALFFLIGVLLVFALAGPVIKEGSVEVKAKSADIMIALDISDSMLAEDVYPNRLKLAKKKAIELLTFAPNERIGVIAFAKNSYLVSPLSFDHEAVKFLLSQLNTKSITEKGTNFLSMLEVVARSIKNDSKKYLLILSDGGDAKDFSKEIAYAKENGISVFVLGIGTTKGAPIREPNGEFIKQNGKIIVTKLNENIASLATKTGGVYIQNVNSNEDIKAMLQEIEKHAEKKELKSEKIEKYIPLFYYPIGLALILLLIATSSMSKRKKLQMPGAFLLFALLFASQNQLHAGVLDFMKLDEAKKAYEQKEYEKAASIYENYAADAQKPESYYNAANALYKAGKYKEAVQKYERAQFDDKSSRAKNFANMGNAYAKMGKEEDLKKAIKEYENSLKIKEDKDTRENLEAVKKALQQMKKKKQQQKKKQNQKNQKNQKNNKNDKNKKDKNDQNKQDRNKNKSDKNKQDKQKQKDQKSKGSQKDKEQQKEKKSKQQSKDEKSSQEQKQKEQQSDKENKGKKSPEKKKDSLKELQEKKEKAAKKKKSAASAAAAQPKDMKNKMSEAEEQKWLKQLNKQQSTFLYMLNNNNKVKKEDTNEKPW